MKWVKRIVFPLLLIAIAFFTARGTTAVIAYLTDSETGVNIMSVGENEVTIEETVEELDGSSWHKAVQIENTGDVPCYLRVYMEFEKSEIADMSMISTDNRATWKTVAQFKNSPGTNWVYVPYETTGDNSKIGGWYYYTQVLQPGDKTSHLMTDVKTDFTDATEIPDDIKITVLAQSRQTLDNDGVAFTGSTPWKSAWLELHNESESIAALQAAEATP